MNGDRVGVQNTDESSKNRHRLTHRTGWSEDSQKPFTFDNDSGSEGDFQLARRLSQDDQFDDGDDLPDISLTRGRVTPVAVSPTPCVTVTVPDLATDEDRNTNQPLAGLSNSNYRATAKPRGVTSHNISLVSDDEEEMVANNDPLDRLFAADPVFNLGKKKNAKGKSKPTKSLATNESDSSVTNQTPTRKKTAAVQTPSSTPKTYVPKSRTGAYAVLVTLYQHSSSDGYPGYLTKSELCQAAQPLADQSFTLASVRAEHYTAWSGVTTLLKHGLVTKWSNPAKFNITDKGVELASRIVSIERGEEAVSDESGGGSERGVKRPSEQDESGQKRRKRHFSDHNNIAGGEEDVQADIRRKRLSAFQNGA